MGRVYTSTMFNPTVPLFFQVWEWQSETYVLKQQGHFFDVNTLAYSPDGQLVVTGGGDGKVGYLYDALIENA